MPTRKRAEKKPNGRKDTTAAISVFAFSVCAPMEMIVILFNPPIGADARVVLSNAVHIAARHL